MIRRKYYLSVKDPLKMVDAGKILSSFFLQTKNFFGVRRIKDLPIKTFTPTSYSRIRLLKG